MTNRKVVSNVATFPITLTIVQGVTANRTGNQILHKTYDSHSGTYGSPSGSDWTAVFNRINTTILADQISAGDGNLRARRRGLSGSQFSLSLASREMQPLDWVQFARWGCRAHARSHRSQTR